MRFVLIWFVRFGAVENVYCVVLDASLICNVLIVVIGELVSHCAATFVCVNCQSVFVSALVVAP